ncbi:hypothetical protein [Sulfurimonas microaerophilic]|uniref:hypothetical protein n=1 Tax=Sulfurimonas microaerophilic TaxID=3058392 RepID=UPI002714C1CF|nr:hypothetical protein [Sulfurimonas sp. hsl 1-7]
MKKRIIQDILKELETNEKDINSLSEDIYQIYTKHIDLIQYINGDTKDMIETRRIKENKERLRPYITAFKQNQQYYDILNDRINSYTMKTHKNVFELYLEDYEKFTKLQSDTYTYFLTYVDLQWAIKTLQNKMKATELNDKETTYLAMYHTHQSLKNIFKFFQYMPLTEKGITTSLSILLYKFILNQTNLKKYQIKELIENLFYQLDIPTTIQINKIDNAIVTAIVNDLFIFAYPGKNDIKSIINLKAITESLNKQIENNKDNIAWREKIKEHLDDDLQPIYKLLGVYKKF